MHLLFIHCPHISRVFTVYCLVTSHRAERSRSRQFVVVFKTLSSFRQTSKSSLSAGEDSECNGRGASMHI